MQLLLPKKTKTACKSCSYEMIRHITSLSALFHEKIRSR